MLLYKKGHGSVLDTVSFKQNHLYYHYIELRASSRLPTMILPSSKVLLCALWALGAIPGSFAETTISTLQRRATHEARDEPGLLSYLNTDVPTVGPAPTN